MGEPGMLEVVTPDPKMHLPEMYDMCSKVFSHMGYFNCFNWCRDAYIGNSHYDWDTATIGILDGRIVTHLGVWGYRMRIASAHVRVAGVGLVATHADYRRRGLMNRTLSRSIQLMRDNGYDLSLLSGIANYYDRFGFVTAWNATEYAIEAHHLPTDKPRVRARKFEPRHRDDLARLYNRENAGRTGTVVRPTFLRSQWPKKWLGYLWNDARGNVSGYVVFSNERDSLLILDCVGKADDILAVLADRLRKLHLKKLVFKGLHHDKPLRKLLTRQSYSWSTTYYRNSGGPMVCNINLRSTLTKLARDLSARLKNSPLANWRGSLLVADAREKVSLIIDRSRVNVAPGEPSKHSVKGGHHIARLLLGSDEPAEVVRDARMKLTGDAHELVHVLFPNNHPCQDRWDHY